MNENHNETQEVRKFTKIYYHFFILLQFVIIFGLWQYILLYYCYIFYLFKKAKNEFNFTNQVKNTWLFMVPYLYSKHDFRFINHNKKKNLRESGFEKFVESFKEELNIQRIRCQWVWESCITCLTSAKRWKTLA